MSLTFRVFPKLNSVRRIFFRRILESSTLSSTTHLLRRCVANRRITDPNVYKIKVGMVKEFAEREGRLPKIGFSDWQTRLAYFVRNQRKEKRNENLQDYQIRLMESIPMFSWGSRKAETFDNCLHRLLQFVEKNGELPKKRGDRDGGDEKKLFSFVSNKRTAYRSGKLSITQIEHLESVPGFKWSEAERYPFEYYLDKIVKFYEIYGELPRRRGLRMIDNANEEEWRLASFLHSQRWYKQEGKLSIEKIEQLENLNGFEWRVFEKHSFEKNVGNVINFCKRYGGLPLRQGMRDDGAESRLATFLATQRKKHRDGLLTESNLRLMESIPNFFWK